MTMGMNLNQLLEVIPTARCLDDLCRIAGKREWVIWPQYRLDVLRDALMSKGIALGIGKDWLEQNIRV
jgi:hypothetical protein